MTQDGVDPALEAAQAMALHAAGAGRRGDVRRPRFARGARPGRGACAGREGSRWSRCTSTTGSGRAAAAAERERGRTGRARRRRAAFAVDADRRRRGARAGRRVDRVRRARSCATARSTRWRSERGLTHVVLAHHRDDQIETVLLSILRGAWPGALAGMPRARPMPGGAIAASAVPRHVQGGAPGPLRGPRCRRPTR